MRLDSVGCCLALQKALLLVLFDFRPVATWFLASAIRSLRQDLFSLATW